MKNILFIVLLFIGNTLLAQGPQIVLDLKTENDDTHKNLGGVTIEIYQDGKKIVTETSSSKGKVDIIIVPIGHMYLIKFKKQGFVTKMAQVDGRYDTPEDLDDEIYRDMAGALFESADGVDFSFLENEPIIKFELSADGYEFSYDQSHLKQMQKKIADLKKKIAKEKANLDKKEAEQKVRLADYQTYVEAGDKAVGGSNYQIAIDQYNLALKLFDKPEVKTKLANAEKLLADANAGAQKDKDFNSKMVEAKNAFDSKNYENALKLYKDALAIKPTEKQPVDQITKINGLLANQKAQEAEFTKLVADGDVASSTDEFDVAIDKYTKALAIKNDPNVKSKLDAVNKLKVDKANADKAEKEKEANYQALMSTAEKLFNKSDWQAAKDKYNEALVIKKDESLPKTQIQLIEKKIEELKADADQQKQLEEKYLAKMSEANTAFESKSYDEAIILYTQAKAIKPTEDDPKVQLNKIADIQKQLADKDANFTKFVGQGDVSLAGELFEDAINFYEKALEIKTDSDVQAKIDKAKKLRSEKTDAANAAKLKEEKYQAAIKAADAMFDTERWEDALVKYNEALLIKSNEAHPKSRISEINKVIADAKAKNEASNQLDEEYNALITAADKLFNDDKLEEARSKYSAALEKKSAENHPIDRIELINSTLAKQAADKRINDKYLSELNAAKALLDSKNYEDALSKYNLASGIKPNEQEPKDQIIAINKLLNDQKNSDELEAEYKALMTEGSGLLANKNLTTALDRFKKALGVKADDQAAKEKIKAVEELIKEQQTSAKNQKDFDELVKKAEVLFSAQNYQDAKLNYTKALAIFDNETVKAKLIEIDALIAKNQSAEEQQKLFGDAMKVADDLYDANEYEKALTKYEIVNSIKKSQHADDRINDINQKLAKLKSDNENQVKYKTLLAEAKVDETQEKYSSAIVKLKEAYAIKPEGELIIKISELESLIQANKNDKAKSQAYIDMVNKADAEYKNENWNQAIDYYKKAKQLKDDETYPDDRIALAKEKIKKGVDAQIDVKYKAAINKADALFKAESLDEAVEFYKKALIIKTDEAYPKNQIKAIQKSKDDKINVISESKNKDEAYKKIVKQGDDLLSAENYLGALTKYEIALSEKPTDLYVISQIEKAKAGVDANKNNADKIAKYDKLIAEGDALMNPGTWNQAKIKYEAAMVIIQKSYPSNQIIICDEMMKKEVSSEAEKAYQKILTVAQKKADVKDYTKAISLYERAKGIRPSDSKPQAKIDEINQLLANEKNDKAYTDLIQKADNLFEKKEWKKSRGFYVKAYALNNDSYADSQIKKIDELDGAYNKKQYDKMLSKADEYFSDKNYEKSRGLYKRAIKFLPNNNNTYPINRIKEIKDILNPPMAVNNGIRNLGEKVIGLTEQEMDALLSNDSEQRKFNEVNSVKKITKEMSSEKSEWVINAEQSTNNTKDKTDHIAVDVQLRETIAEVERVKAEKATIEQRKVYEEIQGENSIYTTQVRFNQKEVIKNIKIEIEENTINADIPRREYEKEVVGINSNVKTASHFQSTAQINESFDQKKYVNHIQKTHVTLDPNNDVARKNTEVFVIDQNIRYSNERNKDSWAQEDAIMKTKVQSDLMVEEIKLSNVDNDIPRQNTVDKSVQIRDENLIVYEKQSKSQIDVAYDVKTYTNNVMAEIRIESITNDVPRQNMEKTTVDITDDIADSNSSFAIDQKKATNSTKDLITKEVEIQKEAFAVKDDERAEDAENVIDLKEDLVESNRIISNKNTDVSFATKDYADEQSEITKNLKKEGHNSIVINQDKTTAAVKELGKVNDEKTKGNQEKVNSTTDYITNMKDVDIQKVDVNVQNQLGKDFPEGVTEEIYQEKDAYGLLLSFVIRRVVVTGGEGNVYEKTKSRHGITSFTKNGNPITKQVWQDNTANASLKRN